MLQNKAILEVLGVAYTGNLDIANLSAIRVTAIRVMELPERRLTHRTIHCDRARRYCERGLFTITAEGMIGCYLPCLHRTPLYDEG